MTAYAGMGNCRLELPPGLPMDGYSARRSPAIGTHDSLEVTVLYVADECAAVAIVGLDLVAAGSELVQRVRRCVQEQIPAAHVFVVASHTHSGPAGVRGDMQVDAVFGSVIGAVRVAASHAMGTAGPVRARIALGELPANVATNRNDPEAVIDRALTVVEITRNDGSRLGLVWHTNVHPTVLGPDNLRYSADLPGEVRRRLRNADEPVLFLNGAAGDVSTRFTRRSRDETELRRLGELLYAAIPLPSDPISLSPVNMAERTVTLQVAEGRHAHHDGLRRATEQRLKSRHLTTGDRRRAESVLEGLARSDSAVPETDSIEALVQVFRLGQLVLVGLPGEPVSALKRLGAHASLTPLLVGYANGYIGYLTTQSDESTYETLASPVEAAAGNRLIGIADELTREVLRG